MTAEQEQPAEGESPARDQALRRTVPAWLLSFLLHGATLAVLVVLVDVTPQGASEEPGRTTGVVIAARNAQAISYLSEDDAGGASAPSTAASASAAERALPTAEEAPRAEGVSLPQPGGAEAEGPPAVLSLPGATGLGQGTGVGRATGAGAGYQTETGVFGVQGKGNKFVYVFDRSFSMAGYGGRPLAAAKRELLASLQVLEPIHQFQVIFYNERPRLIVHTPGERPRMFFGDDTSKRLADSFIRGIQAEGGTRHIDALIQGLDLHPDVLFFLTDADDPKLTADELRRVRLRNRGSSISAIEFGSGSDGGGFNFLRQLAKENGGSHVYVDVTRLPAP